MAHEETILTNFVCTSRLIICILYIITVLTSFSQFY